MFQKAKIEERKNLKKFFLKKQEMKMMNLILLLSLIKQYDIIKLCYQKAQHYINLASNSLSMFKDCEEKIILENLTSFSLSRNF